MELCEARRQGRRWKKQAESRERRPCVSCWPAHSCGGCRALRGGLLFLTHTATVYMEVWLRPNINRSPHCDWQTSGSFPEKHMAPGVLQFGRCWKHDWGPGRWAGGRPPPPTRSPPRLVRKSSDRPPLSESHCPWQWWQSLSVSFLHAISTHHSLVFWPSPLSPPLTRSPNFSDPLVRACSLRKYVSNVCISQELSSEEKQEGECEKSPPWFVPSLTFPSARWDVSCEAASLLSHPSPAFHFNLF